MEDRTPIVLEFKIPQEWLDLIETEIPKDQRASWTNGGEVGAVCYNALGQFLCWTLGLDKEVVMDALKLEVFSKDERMANGETTYGVVQEVQIEEPRDPIETSRMNPKPWRYKQECKTFADDIGRTRNLKCDVVRIGKWWYVVRVNRGYLYCFDGVFRDTSPTPES